VIGATPRERNSRRNNPTVHSVLAVYSSKEPRPSEISPTDGVSTYLALTFGTLLSSQGTDASFVLTLSGFPPGASLRCFRLYQIFSRSDFLGCFPGFRSRVSLSGDPDFIRDSESEFPPPWGRSRALGCAGFPRWRSRKRTGARRPDANRGASLQVHPCEELAVCQTSTTTGRIIGLRR
jgi:hypothetical protein